VSGNDDTNVSGSLKTYSIDKILKRMCQFDGYRSIVQFFVLEIIDVAQTVVDSFEPELFARMHFYAKHFVAFSHRLKFNKKIN
jgi:hypothetical protein